MLTQQSVNASSGIGLVSSVPVLLYAVLLALAVAPPLSAALMLLAAGAAAIAGTWRGSASKLFLLTLGFAGFKLAYYFIVNDRVPLTNIAFFQGEGRLLVFLAVLLVVSSQTYFRGDVVRIFSWMIVLYFLWLPVLFAKRGLGISVGDSSHHELGVAALSGFALLLICQPRRRLLWRYLNAALLVVSLFAVILSGSRTAVLCAMIVVGGVIWVKLRWLARLAFVLVVGAGAFVAVSGDEAINIGNRQYVVGAFKYVGQAMAFGYRYPDSITLAKDGAAAADIQGGDGNVIGRAVIWGKAFYLFSRSPVIGVGPGRFEDQASCSHSSLLFCVHDMGASSYEGASAHNALLHILAEEGIIGLTLALWLCLAVAAAIRNRRKEIESLGLSYPAIMGYMLALAFSSAFQHVLASPLYACAFFVPLLVLACLRKTGRSGHANARAPVMFGVEPPSSRALALNPSSYQRRTPL